MVGFGASGEGGGESNLEYSADEKDGDRAGMLCYSWAFGGERGI